MIKAKNHNRDSIVTATQTSQCGTVQNIPAGGGGTNHQLQMRVQKAGDNQTVESIQVQCTCGSTARIRCIYEP